jgi:hypothetical protein
MSKFYISFDTDWVPDKVLDHTLSLLDEHNITATFFCTNKTECDLSNHEIAIHPNFTTLDIEKHFLEILDLFPDSKGLRSHSLFFTERMRPLLAKHGFNYTSNTMMFEQKNILPYMMSPIVVEMPIYFMDTFNLIMKGAELPFERDISLLSSDGLKVYDFHPIHIYANTFSLDHYDSFKKYYHDFDWLKENVNRSKKGIGDYFVDLLKHINRSGEVTQTLINGSEKYRKIKDEGTNNR